MNPTRTFDPWDRPGIGACRELGATSLSIASAWGLCYVNVYDVRPADPGWQLSKRQGRVLGVYDGEDAAILAARIVGRGNPPSEVWLYESDGTRRIVATYPEEPRPAGDPAPGGEP